MENFNQGQRLSHFDLILNMYARYVNSRPDETFLYTPFWIRYDVGFINSLNNQFTPVGSINRLPELIDTGKIHPNFIVGYDWKPGIYEIHWNYQATETSVKQMTSVQFSISSNGINPYKAYSGNYFEMNAYMILY
jgi:hypothetical protein